MRLLRKLLVLIFVRRKAQAHASAVLANRARQKSGTVGKAGPVVKAASASAAAVAVPSADSAETAARVGPGSGAISLAVSVEPGSARERLIAEALAVRRSREAEWDALTPAQQSRAIVALGEGMAAIVKTFRPA